MVFSRPCSFIYIDTFRSSTFTAAILCMGNGINIHKRKSLIQKLALYTGTHYVAKHNEILGKKVNARKKKKKKKAKDADFHLTGVL